MANDRPPDGEPPARQPGWRPAQDRPTPAPQESASASRGITIELSPRSIRIEPGDVATASIKVRNMGPVVDEITLTPRGEAGGWMRIAPDTLNIYPNTEGEATIRFAPQRAPRPPAGLFAFEIAVNSDRQPDSSMVYRGSVELGSYDNLSAAAAGSTYLTGRRDAILPIKVRNQGNRPTTVQVSAADLPGATVLLSSASFVLEPGGEATVWATIKPRAQFMSGPPRQHPFTIAVGSDYSAPLTIDGRMEQLARFSRRRLVALALLGAVVLTVGGGLVANAFGLIVLPGTGPTPSPTLIANGTPTPTVGPSGTGGPTDTPANQTDEPTNGPTGGPTGGPTEEPTEKPTEEPTANIYEGWEPLAGEFNQAPAAASWGAGRLDVFAPWSDDSIYRNTYEGAWSGWVQDGSASAINFKPGAVSWNYNVGPPNRVDVFAALTDNVLYQQTYDDNGFSDWQPVAVNLIQSGPTATSSGPGRLDVFARGTDDALYHILFINNAWQFWEPIGDTAFTFQAAPGAVSRLGAGINGSNLIDVFVVKDGQLYQLTYDESTGASTAWAPVDGGTDFNSAPAATSWGGSELDVFVRGSDGFLHQGTFNGASWSWQPLSTFEIEYAPAAVAWGIGRIDVFVMGTDKAMYHLWYDNGSWGG